MRLGGFWGMPAPMLLLAFPDISELKATISSMQKTVNSEMLRDLQKEFFMLSKLQDFTVIDAGITHSFQFLMNTCKFQNGHLVAGDGSLSDSEGTYLNEFIRMLAEMIVKGEAKGEHVSLNVNDSTVTALRGVVNNWLRDQSFELRATKSMVRKVYRSIQCESGSSVGERIVSDFGFVRVLPEKVLLNGEIIEITDDMRKICQYFLGRMDTVKELVLFTTSNPLKEEKILDVSFFDLIKRKPESLRYMILSKFEPVRTKASATLIRNTVDAVRASVDLYKECLDKYVTAYGEREKAEQLTDSYVKECCRDISRNKELFLKSLRVKDFTVETFNDILSIYDRVNQMDVSYFNSVFDLNLDEETMAKLFRQVCDLNVCGLNLQQLDLFRQATSNMTVMAADSVKKSEEYMDCVKVVIDDAYSLLGTIREIGGELSV